MASALCENVEDWRLDRQPENFEEHYNGISEINIKEHSSKKNEDDDAETENHYSGTYGIHEEPSDKSVNEEDKHSNDEPEENRQKIGHEQEENISQPIPFYGRTLVAPEYMSFQVQDAASEKENETEVKGEKVPVLASGSDDYGKYRPEEVKTSHDIDHFRLEDDIDCSCEGGDGKFGASLGVEVEDEDRAEGSRKLVHLEEDDDKEKAGDNEDSADLDRQIEEKEDEDVVYKEERSSNDDEVKVVNEVYGQDGEKTEEDVKEDRTDLDLLSELNKDEGEVDKDERLFKNDVVQKYYGEDGEYGEEGKDETENEKVDEENGDGADSIEENERKRDEDNVYGVGRTRNDCQVEEFRDQEDGYGQEKERDEEKTEYIVEVEKKREEHNKVDECNVEKEESEEEEDCKEEKNNNEDAGSGEEDDEIGEDSGDVQVHHEYTIIQDKEAEEESAEDVTINRFTRLEHCDSLRVNVASPTPDIMDVSSAESLNEMDAPHVEGNDADEGEEKLTLEQHEKLGATMNESLEINDKQQNEDDVDEIRSEEVIYNSSDLVEDINEPCQDETKGGDRRDEEDEDLKTVPAEEDAKNERKMDEEDTFTVFQNPLVHEDEADPTGNVRKLGRIFEGGGPVFPKAIKKELDAADGSPVSVRKFKAIFETHQHSTERTFEQGRREELSSPPCGIVKNLRGLFENTQSFETRNGKTE